MEWYPAEVARVAPAATGCFHFDVDVPKGVWASYAIPGQFIRLKPKLSPPGMFALAQPPPESVKSATPERFEFLIKRGTPIAEELVALAAGGAVEVSRVQGKGFPIDKARGHSVLLVATGTGLAPMRAVIQHVRAERAAWKNVTLLFGAFTPKHFPWPDEFSQWEKDGIAVQQIISDVTPGWTGERGFVQRLVEKAPIEDTEAFLVGQREMVAEVRDLLTSRGLSGDHVHLNF
jgi:sulfhydrogenase subunit gamma (sulfur reductase)